MLTASEAQEFAKSWIQAWNSHNLDAIMSHYAVDVVLVSPLAAKIVNSASGSIHGQAALRSYFSRGLEAYPNLAFTILDVLFGVSSILIYFVNEAGVRTGELMEFGQEGKVVRVVATKANLPPK